jgi:hypothetical protein
MKKKLLALLIALVTVVTSFAVIGFAADDNDAIADQIVLSFGKDETERNLAWFSDTSTAGEVRLVEAARVVNGVFPSEYKTFSVSSKASSVDSGRYSKKATLTGLCENTRYAYVFAVGDEVSDIYYFDVGGFGDFDFVFIADPQLLKESDGDKWRESLGKITGSLGADLIISGGDQVNTADDVDLYNAFIIDEMAGVTFAPSVGPGHEEDSPLYGEHYNLPNLSSKYGSNSTSANYWYVYNNVLFMNLNSSDRDAFSNGEHEAFIKEAMAANPDVDWNIVITHYSLFSTGIHGEEMVKYRDPFAPKLTELGVDLVLTAHDHVYVRTHMMDGVELSDDLVVGDTAYTPEATLYVECNSVTGTKLYNQESFGKEWVAKDDYGNKCAIKFEVTETTLSMKSYYLDDMSVFDSFTIEKDAPSSVDAEIKLEGVDVTLTDGVLLNFYVSSSDLLRGIDNTKLVTKCGKECYKITVDVAAKEMGETFTVQLKSGNTAIGDEFSFSVKEYVEGLLDGDYDPETKAVAEALLNYGAAAQNYFDYKTDALVGTPVTDISKLAAATVDSALIDDGEEIFIGASLVLEGKMKLRFYFEGERAITVDGKNVSTVKKGGYCYAEIGVSAATIDRVYEIKCGSTTVKYSALNYLKNRADDSELSEMVASIFAYFEAAKEFAKDHCTHEGAEYELVQLPTIFSEGVRAAHCDSCGKDVSETVEKTEPVTSKLDGSSADVKYEVNVLKDVLDGKHFYPDEENDYKGRDLYVEFSLLWNETLENSERGWAEFSRLHADGNVKNYDAAYWYSLRADCSSTWGSVGDFEYGRADKVVFGPNMANPETTPNAQFVNIGEYGWHRIGIQTHQEVVSVEGTKVKYKFTITLYVDGVKASVIEYSDCKHSANRLFTAEVVDGELVYSDISNATTVLAYRVPEQKLLDGDAYFVTADTYITAGDGFLLDVEPVANPKAAVFEADSGVSLSAKAFFKTAGAIDEPDDPTDEPVEPEPEACKHEGVAYTVIPTLFSEGQKNGHCDECGKDVSFAAPKSEPEIYTFTTDKPASGQAGHTYKTFSIVDEALGEGQVFYPAEENNYEGRDLYLEFSILFNESLEKLNKGTAYIGSIGANGEFYTSSNDRPIWFGLKTNTSGCDCTAAGGFETLGGSVTKGDYTCKPGNNSTFPYVGEYGWHRIGLKYHLEIDWNGTTPEYTTYITIYIDGEEVVEFSFSGLREKSLLYTAEKDSEGNITYTNIDSDMTIDVFRMIEDKANSDKAYLVIGDAYVSAGDGFVLDVEPVENPADATLEVETGVSLGAKAYYKVK